MKASWEKCWVNRREVMPGQFITTRRTAAAELKVDPAKWYRGMHLLQEWGQVKMDVNHHETVITICNWEGYQCNIRPKRTTSEPPVNHARTTDEPPVNHLPYIDEEVKEGKDSARSQKKFIKPTLEEVKAYCQERNSRVDPEQFFAHYEANGWVQGNRGKPLKDWKAAVITWEKNNFRNGKAGFPGGQTNLFGGMASWAEKAAADGTLEKEHGT